MWKKAQEDYTSSTVPIVSQASALTWFLQTQAKLFSRQKLTWSEGINTLRKLVGFGSTLRAGASEEAGYKQGRYRNVLVTRYIASTDSYYVLHTFDCPINRFEPIHTLSRNLRRKLERGHESESQKTCISQSPILKCRDSVCDSVVEIESCHCHQSMISTLIRLSDRCTYMPFHLQAS